MLARWSGWGPVPGVFDPDRDDNSTYAWAREELAGLLDEDELRAARRTILNAHYTDAAVVQVIWAAVRQLGFAGGDVLEPGCGSGNFIGFAPPAARMVGVELDPTTAAVCAALYPQAQILAENFADTRIRDGTFDLVVGNVPFGQISLADRRHNPAGHRIHDHFIIKGLHLLRPGGIMAVLTSHYSMDRANPAARREIAGLADLLGAVRLPAGAMARAAGTEAVIDLLLLRRREDDRPAAASEPWETTRTVVVGEDEQEVRVNAYFLDHPDRVLGRLGAGGLYRADELMVIGERDCASALAAALAGIVADVESTGLSYSDTPADARAENRPIAFVAAVKQHPEGYLTALPDGRFTQVVDGQRQPYRPPKTQAAELRDLLGLRDTVLRLLAAEAASGDDTDEIGRLRAELDRRYDGCAGRYGPINRYNTYPTGKVDDHTGELTVRRLAPAQGGFRTDPFANVVYALERFDEDTQTATKADIFTMRAIAPRVPKLGADTPEDAIAICRDTYGELSLDRVAWLLGVDETQARLRLGVLVFDEPGTGRLVLAAEYLSGDVRAKLEQACTAAAQDDRYAPNVDALTAVKPRDLTPEEIRVRPGASWVSGDVVQQFLRELLDDPTLVVEHGDGGTGWEVTSKRRGTTAATSTWGTGRMSAVAIAQALLQQRPVRVYDLDPSTERRTLNPDATLAAQAKATEINERFAEWLWEEPQRATEHTVLYNRRFNSLVLRSYDDTTLSLPGLALTFKPHPHQYAAVARIINEPSVGLFHEVGAGKTAEMVMGAMELRRLGLARRPLIIVPNHMLEQFSREFLQLYPRANLLAASSADLAAARRRLFQARVTTGDWDAVIMTHRAFEQVAMSSQFQRTYLRSKVDKLKRRLAAAEAAKHKHLVKQLEASIARAEERIKKKLETKKDPGLTFEMMGVDYLFVDEGHLFKNLERSSKIPGMGVIGSNRATDLDMKLHWLRETNDRVCTIATATPIANSIGEVHTMLMYLAPELMERLRIDEFDAWAATFGETVEGVEVVPEGGGLRVNSRFAKFYNVPELLRILHQVADVKTGDDLNLPVPRLRQREDGQRAPQIVVVPPSDELSEFLTALVDRADRVRHGLVDPTEDNLLKITHHGRSAAMDLRLVPPTAAEIAAVLTRHGVFGPGIGDGDGRGNGEAVDAAARTIASAWARNRPNPLEPNTVYWPTDLGDGSDAAPWPGPLPEEAREELLAIRSIDPAAPSKLTTAADTIARIYAEHRDDVFTDEDGRPHPRPGALQIVFSDLGVPADGWSAYGELCKQLVARGVPRNQIRFMHEADNDAEKAQLFAAARDGRVSVLIGSTEKMGVGTNVQARAVALHHLDCPWRPADLQQREGRILRQGNQNAEVDIFRYVTEGSFDGFMWQTVARKAQFIAQMMRGRLDVREIEDIGDAALSYNEVKALATGNPLLLDQAALQAEVTKLERLERAHHREHDRLAWVGRETGHEIRVLRAEVDEIEALRQRRVETTGGKSGITVLGRHTTERKQANLLLLEAMNAVSAPPGGGRRQIATIGGFTVAAEIRWNGALGKRILHIDMPELPNAELTLAENELAGGADLVARLENRLRGLDIRARQLKRDLAAFEEETERLGAALDQPFKHIETLRIARTRLEDVNARIAEQSASAPPGSPPPAEGLASPGSPPDMENEKRRIDPGIIRPGRPGRLDGNDSMQVLTLTIAAINTYGWASRRDADASGGNLVPTAAIVDTALNGDGPDANALRAELEALITDETREYATAVRAYATTLTDRDSSEYAFQLRHAAAEETVPQRHFSALVSAVNSYQRHLQDRAVHEATAKSTWQGRPGEPVDFDAKVLLCRTYSRERAGRQSAVTMVYLADPSGNLFTWWAPNLNTFREGAFVHVAGKIKAHEIAEVHQRTELTRCVLTPTAAPPDRPASETATDLQAVCRADEPELAPVEEDRPPAPPSPIPARAVSSVDLSGWIPGPGARATTAEVAWLIDTMTALANEPQVQAWALANEVENFAYPFAERLSTVFVESADQQPDLLGWAYFADGQARMALENAAADAVYAAITSTAEGPGRTRLDETLPDTVDIDGDMAKREAKIRQRQIILKIEEYAAGYQRVTGAGYRYVAEIVDAAPDEREWIKNYINEHPDVLELPYRTPAQWDEIHRTRGDQALQKARFAADSGDSTTALDCLDEARECGVLSERDWHAIRHHLHDSQPSERRKTLTHGAEEPCLLTSSTSTSARSTSATTSYAPSRSPAWTGSSHVSVGSIGRTHGQARRP